MKDLLKHLATLPTGSVSDADELEALLAASWDEFAGSTAERMAADKLFGRVEDVRWQPPVLSFRIVRHGGTVLGSTRAEVHEWVLDVDRKTAACSMAGRRQLKPMGPKVDVGPSADEIFHLIAGHQEDSRLKWGTDGGVRVNIGAILPDRHAVKATVTGRRKRFRRVLAGLLADAGWKEVRANVYAPPAASTQYSDHT